MILIYLMLGLCVHRRSKMSCFSLFDPPFFWLLRNRNVEHHVGETKVLLERSYTWFYEKAPCLNDRWGESHSFTFASEVWSVCPKTG